MKELFIASRILLKRIATLARMPGAAWLALAGAMSLQAQTPLYQWNFNGVSGTGVPAITAGGGTLGTTIGAGNFNGTGLTAAATDWTYKGGTANDGVRSAADIAGLGTMKQMTVTFWMNASVAYASQSTTFGRFLMLGNSTSYDESAGNASPGFSFAQNGTGLQYNVNNGVEPILANFFTPYAANQWVFVVLEYDGLGATNSSSALGAAIGNSSANLAIISGTTTSSIGAPAMLPLTTSGSTSPGPLTNTATMALMVGNRASGGRGFQGQIDNINIFTNLLTISQLETLRISSYATTLTAGVIASAANPIQQGTTVTLSAGYGGGTAPYTVQWQTDGGSGTFTNISGATSGTLSVNTTGLGLGNFQYQAVVTDNTTATVTTTPLVLNVIKVIAGTLTDLGTTAPTAGSSDAAQLTSAFTYQAGSGLNYYDNTTPAMGQTFTTGSNAKGYSLNALAIQLAGGNSGSPAAGGANLTSSGMTNQAYDLRVYSVSGSSAIMIADVTNLSFSFANTHWIQWNFPALALTNNATYAYTFQIRNTANYCGLSTSDALSDHYAGGQMVAIPNGGGPITFSSSANNDATFDVGLIPNGVPFFLTAATATPNPAYALSSVKLNCAPTTAGIYTYKWMGDDGSGNNLTPIPGATATNLTIIPPDLNPGGADYTTNYYFVATDTTSGNSVTSSVVALIVHAAAAPQFSVTPTPTNLVTFVGGSVIYSATEVGTLPITNQWRFDNGGGYVSLTSQTNTTLALSNLQLTNTGTYQLAATNVVGNASTAVTLTVLPAPPAPVLGQKYFNAVYTNNPWAYWRLNETNDPTAPGAPTYRAYDYSGHNFNPTYGNAVTVNNPGPQTPTFPGFDASELAAGTTVSTPNAYLTVPALNLAGSSNVTFMAWINPNGAQAASAGLLFNRGGPDVACGFGFGATQDHLGYTWNNNALATYSWDSGLAVADNQWNFVAYVITPTNATVYLANLSGGTTNFSQAVNPVANTPETFAGGSLLLGGDSSSLNRSFYGLMAEATVFTNALTTAQLQQYFLTAIGAAALPVVVGPAVAAPSANVYSGQNVLLSATVSGSAPLTNQWQMSSDSVNWSNIPGATNATLLINPQTVGTFYYQLSVANATGSSTGAPVSVTFSALPVYPSALWTASFQVTNNLDGSQNTGGGLGHYVGRGAVGNGTYWNILPQVLPAGSGYNSSSIVSVTDLLDDGVTHSGVFCQMNSGGGYNGPGTALPYSSDIGNLLGQWFRTYYSAGAVGNGALQFVGAPAGTYNVVCYGGSGLTRNGSADLGSTYVVFDAVNGNQTNSTAAPSPTTALAEGVNFATFTNVHISGTLNVDVLANPATGGGAIISGAQLQLVSYDPPTAAFTGTPTNVLAAQTVTFTNVSAGAITNAVWTFGDGSSVTNSSNVGVSHSYASSGTYTVSLSVSGPGGGPVSQTRTGYIVVVSNVPISSTATLAGGKFILSGANGTAGAQYRILTTTNLTLPVTNWIPVITNVFLPDGTYSYTNSSVTNAASFFRLVTP